MGASGLSCRSMHASVRVRLPDSTLETLYAGEEIALSLALRRRGHFVILPERVVTSGRKLRTHSVFEVLGVMGRIGLLGTAALRSREGLGVWYGPRREDPEELRA